MVDTDLSFSFQRRVGLHDPDDIREIIVDPSGCRWVYIEPSPNPYGVSPSYCREDELMKLINVMQNLEIEVANDKQLKDSLQRLIATIKRAQARLQDD